jgi:xanthosine utilization system XapX-like protein
MRIWIGFSLAGLCVVAIVYAALAIKAPADVPPRQLNLVILVSGGLMGWVIGITLARIRRRFLTPGEPFDFRDEVSGCEDRQDLRRCDAAGRERDAINWGRAWRLTPGHPLPRM